MRAGRNAPAISFVIPVFNEEGNVEKLHAELTDVADEIGRPYEILFVNDGSTDATLERLSVVAVRDPHLRVVDLAGNFGEAAALCAGFANARGDVVMSLDGDGQNDPHDFPRFLRRLERDGLDAVSGRRVRRKEPFLTRVLPSKIANGLIATLTRVPVHDCGCGLKVYRRWLVQDAQLPKGMNRFMPAILGVDGHRVAEEPTQDRPRGSGSSHYGLSRIFVVFRDLLALPLLVRRPPVGRPTVRVLASIESAFGIAAATAVAATFLSRGSHWPWAVAAVAGALSALAVSVMRFNVTRFVDARERGVFAVRRVIDGNAIAERGDRRSGVLGQEPAADLQPDLGEPRLSPV